MNEDMKKTLDHAYEVLGVTKRDIENCITQGQVEDLINQKLSDKITELDKAVTSEKEKNQALAELRACYTMVLIDYRESEGRSTDDIRQVHIAKAEKYAEIYQKKQYRTKKELAEKTIKSMFESLGIKTEGKYAVLRGINADPKYYESALEPLKLMIELAEKYGQEIKNQEEIKNNLSFLESLTNKTPEERIEICNKYIEKNKAKKADPANKANSNGKAEENSKENKFKNWLKKFKTAVKTHIDARYPITWGKRH